MLKFVQAALLPEEDTMPESPSAAKKEEEKVQEVNNIEVDPKADDQNEYHHFPKQGPFWKKFFKTWRALISERGP